jgi:hypothetical protein
MADAMARLAAGEVPVREPQRAGAGAYYTYPAAAVWAAFMGQDWTVATPEDLRVALARFGLTARE